MVSRTAFLFVIKRCAALSIGVSKHWCRRAALVPTTGDIQRTVFTSRRRASCERRAGRSNWRNAPRIWWQSLWSPSISAKDRRCALSFAGHDLRAYAREKLDEAGESYPFQRRHAAYYRDFFEADKTGWGRRSAADLAESAAHIGNLRTALEWAFSPQGDKMIGVALAAYAVPLWIQLSLVDECTRSYVELAL